MAKVRTPGDPWHTVLYKDPYKHWWAPALFVFPALLVARQVITDEGLFASAFFAAAVAGAMLLGFRWKRRSPRRG